MFLLITHTKWAENVTHLNTSLDMTVSSADHVNCAQ